MRLDQLSGLVAFLRVAETKSFTTAARQLGVTPPSLSESVKGLEERLGVRLLDRTTRSVGLTEAGIAYVARVQPAVAEILGAGTTLRAGKDEPAGLLRITAPWAAGPLVIEPLIAPFLSAYPAIALDVVYENRFVDIAREGYDAGIRIGDLLEKDMIAARIGKPLRTAILASPGYLTTHGAPKRIADLAKHACIGYRFTETRVVAAWDLLDNGREITFTPDPRLSTNTVQLAIHAACEGIGLVHAIEALAAEPLRDGRLVRVLPALCQTFDAFHIYYSSRRLVPAKLRAFVNLATKRLRR